MDLKAQYEHECDKFNDAQQRFYRASAEKTNAESDMTSSRETIENLEKQLQQLSRSPGCYVSVPRKPGSLSIGTLCRLMDDCLPEQIDDERDMQRMIDKLWPALVCEFELET
mgnify:CR=1 FL=1